MFFRTLAALTALSLAACATTSGPKVRTIDKPFNAAETQEMLKPGTRTIQGSALLRQQGGGVVTCAGEDVLLFPATPYAAERIEWIFGIKGPRASIRLREPIIFRPDPVEFHTLVKRATCDAQGAFVFTRMSPGRYYLLTRVSWATSKGEQGGQLMRQLNITPDDDETVRVVLSD